MLDYFMPLKQLESVLMAVVLIWAWSKLKYKELQQEKYLVVDLVMCLCENVFGKGLSTNRKRSLRENY